MMLTEESLMRKYFFAVCGVNPSVNTIGLPDPRFAECTPPLVITFIHGWEKNLDPCFTDPPTLEFLRSENY